MQTNQRVVIHSTSLWPSRDHLGQMQSNNRLRQVMASINSKLQVGESNME